MSTSTNKQFAVVTGGSSGIGLELAKQFAQNGFDVLIAAEPDGLTQAAQEISALGASVETLAVDLASHDGVHLLWDRIQSGGRPLDAIAINAGVGVGGPFTETDFDAEMNMINLNIVSTYHLAKHAVKDMAARNSGKILFTSSVAGVMPAPFEAVYGATKAFILSLSEALFNELKDTDVTVTALMPGPNETNFFHRADMDDTPVGQSKKDDPAGTAKEGFAALMVGKDKIIAGSLKTKVQGHASEVLPDKVTAEQHRKMSEPISDSK